MATGTASYFGDLCGSEETGEAAVSLMVWEPGQVQPWHEHENDTLFLICSGGHYDESRHAVAWQPQQSVLYRPAGAVHRARVSPEGVSGVNIELTSGWFAGIDRRPSDLGPYRAAPMPPANLAAIRLALAFHRDAIAEEVAGLVIEAIEPLIAGAYVDAGPIWLARAEEYVRASFQEAISLRVVAREVGIDPIHLARTFRARKGFAISEYVRRLRLAEAVRGIMHEGQTACEAASSSGFCDQGHLSRTMKQEFGASPSSLRQVFKPGNKLQSSKEMHAS